MKFKVGDVLSVIESKTPFSSLKLVKIIKSVDDSYYSVEVLEGDSSVLTCDSDQRGFSFSYEFIESTFNLSLEYKIGRILNEI